MVLGVVTRGGGGTAPPGKWDIFRSNIITPPPPVSHKHVFRKVLPLSGQLRYAMVINSVYHTPPLARFSMLDTSIVGV